jgi:hypothetical protein
MKVRFTAILTTSKESLYQYILEISLLPVLTFLISKVRIVYMLHYRVEYYDVRPPNVLQSSEGGKVMLVDFERSEILKLAPALQEISPNLKRRRLYSIEGTSCAGASYGLFTDKISYHVQKAS